MMYDIEYGVQRRWTDGHVETDPCDARHLAEASARYGDSTSPDVTAAVVARTTSDTGWTVFTEAVFQAHTEQLEQPTVRWGAQLTWPHGYVEVRDRGHMIGRYQRRDAELRVAGEVQGYPGMPNVAAVLVYRMTSVSQWAAELTWPDGHVEYHDRDTRREAESKVASENDGYRAVTTTAWAPPEPAQAVAERIVATTGGV